MDESANFAFQFEPALIEEIETFGELRSFKDGDIIMDYGKYIRMMPLVVRGTLKVLKKDDNGNEILLYYLSSSETCSMAYSCCLEEKKSEVKAIAEGDLQIIAIPHNKLDEWLCKYPSWKNYIMRSFNERFSELLKSIESIAFHKLDDRLIAYLKEKKRLSGSNLIRASHYQIADELATSRVVISRLLKILENNGKILLYRNEIKLLHNFDA
ncbi:Crp/Fnr family transcriptional regulator [Mucilaginibacter rubeus]|uniref:Crp/Fnr family transcriptional regulator n=1 Tax=Mucilaginibacter rubeus TaxID=2027860 RepID=A0AAE6JHW1_9SPHI|nr:MULTISPECIES: Crp/Fnr family transcriptional regulator [Mucilaginibacter]QEM05994.1 Crp/Fnr family transcriptional regulator [Mucilaginibacter rubeus]QEM18575.1 Crp/Fnr family transcriptional regulator [Mucilaginibacter gossypii]QTE44882.1 Crp/Fnr family transcriptional regulator [Mucilaginibacter rubeus]QTE51480.1 Crp/Fnr family transcriptional regulator [Mucilaginibacter rubeus]QTE56566.1 Crp/Fnr family transcriptional regulator [Mucilaginibacter rubeus]